MQYELKLLKCLVTWMCNAGSEKKTGQIEPAPFWGMLTLFCGVFKKLFRLIRRVLHGIFCFFCGFLHGFASFV